MRMITRTTWATLSLFAAVAGCSGNNDLTSPPSTGGSNGVGGGSTGQGGGLASGGSSAADRTTAPGTGGAVSGGSGSVGTGGKIAFGGTNATGGSKATGGTPSAGGTPSTGGSQNNATGGSVSTGTGGIKAIGGSAPIGATGGSKPTGGSSATGSGGTGPIAATGGNVGVGGSSPAGGAASFTCANLSLAPSTSGQAKPSGTAGGMKVLDWAGFKGAVSFTFDDNRPSQMTNYSKLKGSGAHFTWFVVGSWTPSSQYKSTLADGQEIANHTYSHNSTGSQSDLQQNETYITTNFGVTANSMAAPNCDQSWSTVAPNVLFQNRGPCGQTAGTVGPRDSTSAFLLPAYLPNTNESSTTMISSFTTGKWRIFVVHGFDGEASTYQPVSSDEMAKAMTNAVTNGYWTEGITNVGAYWQGQKLISSSASTSATWSLPAHFPKNMCVRITTTGGTVTQGGQAVPWDDHGYYQISLDAGSVTIQ